MAGSLLDELKQNVEERQVDLNDTLLTLEKRAAEESGRGKWVRVVLIFLGALVVTREVADKVFPQATPAIPIFYAVAGLLVATLGGIEAAFTFQKSASDLRKLAAECNSYIQDIDSRLLFDLNTPEAEQNLRQLLALQNEKLTTIHNKAAEVGVNITRKVRKLRAKAA
jgi:hypothetical protein